MNVNNIIKKKLQHLENENKKTHLNNLIEIRFMNHIFGKFMAF